MATAAMKGASVSALPKRSRMYAEGRVCEHPDCNTKLSVYNRRETCFAHAEVRIPRLRGRKTA